MRSNLCSRGNKAGGWVRVKQRWITQEGKSDVGVMELGKRYVRMNELGIR